MTHLRKATAALSAAAAILIATPPTASATPAPHAPSNHTYGGTLAWENFDRLPLGPVTEGRGWTTDTSNGTLTVEPSSTGHGRELHLHTEGNGHAFMVLSDLAPPGNSFWARVRLRVTEFPTAPDWAHWTLAEASGPDSPTLVRPLGGQYAPTDTGNFWGVGSDLGPTGDWTNWKTSAPAVAGKWQCVEFRLDATDNRVMVYLDGTAQPDLTVSTKNHGGTTDDFVFPTFDKLKLGWQLYQSNPAPTAFDMRMDDIAVSSRRVGGCET
ncbi:hypothetical protein F9278_31470 [Streptomyces phaeolivaceus]|uniref:Cip1-like core domain-containing protein n=1 Tax=Streptomyces phaeolivaceus TaxID=2653200 RepID=A0A5P8KBC1_9ACTN|nr:hypothetical protein [Streptomyces phaeolivaceus]QFQ99927.1 hypothetical protein F9278_31470 [Streptomyces phaeolivaceus]